jgi:phage terminase small subunit
VDKSQHSGSRGATSPPAKVKELNARQREFVRQYSLTGNATKSAKLAGYSEASAKSIGSALLTNPNVKRELAELEARASEQALRKYEVTEEFVIGGLKLYAQGNIQDFLDEDGRPVANLKKLDRDTTEPIAEVTVKTWSEGKGENKRTFTETKIKMEDRQRARELLGKKLKLWTDKTELEFPGDMRNLTDEQLDALAQRLRRNSERVN